MIRQETCKVNLALLYSLLTQLIIKHCPCGYYVWKSQFVIHPFTQLYYLETVFVLFTFWLQLYPPGSGRPGITSDKFNYKMLMLYWYLSFSKYLCHFMSHVFKVFVTTKTIIPQFTFCRCIFMPFIFPYCAVTVSLMTSA